MLVGMPPTYYFTTIRKFNLSPMKYTKTIDTLNQRLQGHDNLHVAKISNPLNFTRTLKRESVAC